MGRAEKNATAVPFLWLEKGKLKKKVFLPFFGVNKHDKDGPGLAASIIQWDRENLLRLGEIYGVLPTEILPRIKIFFIINDFRGSPIIHTEKIFEDGRVIRIN